MRVALKLAVQAPEVQYRSMKTSMSLFALAVHLLLIGCATTGPKPTSQVLTPSIHSQEYAAITSSVKGYMAKRGIMNYLVFDLKVHNGWARIEIMPQSSDGTKQHQWQTGLLRKDKQSWVSVEWMPPKEANHVAAYVEHLKRKYPQAPDDIFPKGWELTSTSDMTFR